MFQKNLTIVIILFLGLFFFTNTPIYAQIKETDLVLKISPENPEPDQSVTATLESYVADLDKSLISWSVNNEKLSYGIGKKSFSFNVGELGSETTVSALVETASGQTITKILSVTSSSTDLIWEAYDSYAPPFYRGKTLVAPEGMFKVVAMPDTNAGESISNFSYNWKHNGKVKQSASGWGKNYLIFKNSSLDKEDAVETTISNIFGVKKGEGKINLRTSTPEILFYNKDQNGIRMGSSLPDGYTLNKEGETIVAVPYFFSPKNLDSGNISFKWLIGNKPVKTPATKNELAVKGIAGQTGGTTISVFIENTKMLFQSLGKQIDVNF